MSAKTFGTRGVVAFAVFGLIVPVSLAGPATEPAIKATPAQPGDATFVAAMQELGGRAPDLCCHVVCQPSVFGSMPSACAICCPLPRTYARCACTDDGLPYCECVITSNQATGGAV